VSKLPSFQLDSHTNLQELPKQEDNASNLIFKRHARNNKPKLLRRNTEL
jgi:hypothetical protein